MSTQTFLRRLVLLGTPLILGIMLLWHPVGPGQPPFDVVAQHPTWWTILHLLQLPLFAFLALAVALLTWGLSSRAATVSRVALGFFAVFYLALDAITGVASGIIVREAQGLSDQELAVIKPLVAELFLGGGPYTFIPVFAVFGWVIALMAAAVALSRAGVSLVPVSLLGVAAITFGVMHEPPFGPIGMAAFAAAVAMIELWPHRFWQSCSIVPGDPNLPAIERAPTASPITVGSR